MGGVIGIKVTKDNPSWQPSLLNFGIGVRSAIVVTINSFKNGEVGLWRRLKSAVENYLQVTIESKIHIFIWGRRGTTEGNIVISELGSNFCFRGREVKRLRS